MLDLLKRKPILEFKETFKVKDEIYNLNFKLGRRLTKGFNADQMRFKAGFPGEVNALASVVKFRSEMGSMNWKSNIRNERI